MKNTSASTNSETKKQGSITIEDAIYNNFSLADLDEAIRQESKVDNREDDDIKNTEYSFFNAINNKMHRGETIDPNNLTAFAMKLVAAGMTFDEKKFRDSKFKFSEEELNSIRNSQPQVSVGKHVKIIEERIARQNENNGKGGGRG